MITLEKMLVSLAIALVTAGCGCREEASSDERGSRATTAKRWQPEAPAKERPSQQSPAEQSPKSDAEPPSGKNDPAPVPADVAPADARPEPAAPPGAHKTEGPVGVDESTIWNPGPGIVRLTTEDCDAWPSYDWPLEMKIEVLEFPERITMPSPPIPDD